MNFANILNQLTISDLLAAGLVIYFTNIIVQKATSLPAQLFWLIVSLFGMYKVYDGYVPVVSVYSISVITIFFTVLPVIKSIYYIFINAKNKVIHIAPEIPKYESKFGPTPEQMELRKSEDRRAQEKHNEQQKYFKKLIDQIDEF